MNKGTREAMVRLYEGDIWGDSIHPGGMALTERLACLVGIGQDCTVLDVASGKGATGLFLAEKYGCRVVGADLSMEMVAHARQRSSTLGIEKLPTFVAGEAEMLPFSDQSFDIVFCECSFSLIPKKDVATKEFYRILRRGGRLGIADFYLRVGSPSLESELPYLCLDGTETQETYQTLMHNSGFHTVGFEDHTEKLKELFLDLMLSFGSINAFLDKLPRGCCNREYGAGVSADIEKGFRGGAIGYCVVTGTK